jgi:hypothetical protein
MRKFHAIGLLGLSLLTLAATAADTVKISKSTHDQIQAGMQSYVGRLTVGSVYRLYDPVNGRVYQLKFQKIRSAAKKSVRLQSR